MTRRKFMASSAAAAGVTIVPSSVLGATGNPAPSQKVNVAVIGVGGMGTVNLGALLGHADVQVVALCDVDEGSDGTGGQRGSALKQAHRFVTETYSEQAKSGAYKGCGTYASFDEMLENEESIDAVVVATPDHNHAVATMAAIKKGKHVYCEKPLTHSVYETRIITEAARAAGVATQMGNQGHSGEGIRLTVEWIRAGAIGPIREVHGWTSAGRDEWSASPDRPEDTPPVPETLDWDRWLGPAPERPYHPAYAPYNWRGWWDFGNGAIGDMACHNLDPAIWALDLGFPTTVEASSTMFNDETVPVGALYQYEFPARGEMPPVTMKWYDGGLMPPRPEGLEDSRRMGDNGIYFVGDDGVIKCPGWGGAPRIIPEKKMKAFERPEKTIPRVEGHHRDWLNACKGGDSASSNFNYSGPLTEIALVGTVALRCGKKIQWDGESMTAANAPEADQYVRPAYRDGWTL
jgi:predicted dehydrogenase